MFRFHYSRTFGRLIWLILGGFGLIWLTSPVSGYTQATAVDLRDALSLNAVQAVGKPIVMGFKQPIIALTLNNQTDASITLEIPAGLQLIPAGSSFAPLVIIKPDQVTLDPRGQATRQLYAMALDYTPGKGLPSLMNPVDYQIGGMEDKSLLDLIARIQAKQAEAEYGAQLAIWMVKTGDDLDQIATTLNTPFQPSDIALAEELIGRPVSTLPPEATTPAPLTSESLATAEPGNTGGTIATPGSTTTSHSSLGIVLAVVAGLAVALMVALGILSSMRNRTVSTEETLQVPESRPKPGASPQGPEQPGPVTAPHVPPRVVTVAVTPEPVILTLTGTSGPHNGKIMRLTLPCIISRGSLSWALEDEAALSVPHALFDMTEIPFRVKDLNSSNGTYYQNQSVGRGWTELEDDQTIQLGHLRVVTNPGGLKLSGGPGGFKVIPASSGLVVISRMEVHVTVIGDQDKKISDAHSYFYQNDKAVMVRDLNSTNGISVNGEKIQKEALLTPDAKILIGASEFVISFDPNCL